MVEAVSKVTSTRKTEAVASANEKVEKKAQKEETQKAKETDKIEDKKSARSTMDRSKVERLVREYIDKLKKDNDYPAVTNKLDTWLLTFDVDKFIKTYPEIYSEMDLRTIMYNETISYL